jgi:phosphate transport system permease protein
MTIASTARARLWHSKRKVANTLLWVLSALAVVSALVPLVFLLYYVVRQGLPGLNLSFFLHMPKPVGETGGGMANAIVGSLILVGLASAVGLPIGILGGIYLAEFGNNRFGWSVRFAADVLSGVPSIVIGIFVYAMVVLPMEGFSALAGGAALGVMMIPTVIRTTEELVRLVPMSLREASLSLGATHWRTVFRVVLPAARAGVVTGVLLSVARIAGETAPLLVTSLGYSFMSVRVDQPIASLPMQILNYALSPYDDWNAQAWTGALVLVLMILILSVAARYATRGRLRMTR